MRLWRQRQIQDICINAIDMRLLRLVALLVGFLLLKDLQVLQCSLSAACLRKNRHLHSSLSRGRRRRHATSKGPSLCFPPRPWQRYNNGIHRDTLHKSKFQSHQYGIRAR